MIQALPPGFLRREIFHDIPDPEFAAANRHFNPAAQAQRLTAELELHDLAFAKQQRLRAIPVLAIGGDARGCEWKPSVHGMRVERLTNVIEPAGDEESGIGPAITA